MSTLLHDLRHGWRTLRRSPGFTAAAVATLALGIGANGAIFSAVDGLLFAPLPFPHAGRLVLLTESYPVDDRMPVALPNFVDWERASGSFEELAVYRAEEVTLGSSGSADEPERVTAAAVSADLLPLLGAGPRLGRGFLPAEDRPGEARTALLGQALFHRRFGGDPAVVGSTVRLDGEPFTVVGVAPFDFALPQLGTADLWLPLGVRAEHLMNRGRHSNTQVLGRLRPGVSLARARAEMAGIARRLAVQYPDTNAQGGVALAPLEERLRGSLRQPLLLLWGAVGFVLLVACANVANLLLAQAEARQREVAIRSALGASTLRLARQMVTETALLALLGGAAGTLLAAWGVDLLRTLAEQSVPGRMAERIALDGRTLGFTALLALATGLLLGLAPAARLRAGALGVLGRALQGRGGSEGTGRGRIQPLVTAEVALALLLAAGAGLMARSLWNLARVDPGFAPEGAATLELALPEAGYEDLARVRDFFDRVEERSAALPGVQAAGLIEYLPLSGSNSWTSVAVEGWPPPAPGEGPLSLSYRTVSPGAFRALGIPLLRGRPFTAADREGAPGVVIVDEALARRLWPGQDPIGRWLRPAREPLTVVGVVGAARMDRLGLPPEGLFYRPFAQQPERAMVLVARTAGDPAALLPALRSEVRSVSSDVPLDRAATLAEVAAGSVASQRHPALLLALFAVLALVLAAVGVHGVTAYAVARRTREIGIRRALGAQRRDVLRAVAGREALSALLGLVLGLAGAFLSARLLSGLLYGVAPTDLPTLAGAALLLAAVAGLASYLPARRAARTDPMAALRTE